MRSWPKLMLAFVATVSVLFTQAFAVELSYEPKAGETAEYDLQVQSKSRDAAGLHFDTAFKAILKTEILDVQSESDDADDPGRITGATVRITQSDAVAEYTSGEKGLTVELPDKSITVKAGDDGAISEIISGEFNDILAETLAAVCAELAAVQKPKVNQQWPIDTKINCLGESIPVEITSTLVGSSTIQGEDCIHVNTSCEFSHTFENAEISRIVMSWAGDAHYAYKKGKFARIAVDGEAKGFAPDGTESGVNIRLVLAAKNAEEQASVPVENSLLAGVASFNWPPAALTLFIVALGAAFVRRKPKLAGKLLAVTLSASLVIFGMPLHAQEAAPAAPPAEEPTAEQPAAEEAPAEETAAEETASEETASEETAVEETPGEETTAEVEAVAEETPETIYKSAPALAALSTAAHEAVGTAAGMTTAAGAGIGMGGTTASSLSIAYSAAPAWAAKDATSGIAVLPAGFMTAPAAVAGAGTKAGAGVFTATNLLIGGGLAVAAGGTTAAVVEGTRSSKTRTVILCSTVNADPVTTSDPQVLILINAHGAPDSPADVVNVILNDSTVIPNATLNAWSVSAALDLNLGAANTIEIEYVSGGSNDCILADVALEFLPSSNLVGDSIRVGPGNKATWIVTQQ